MKTVIEYFVAGIVLIVFGEFQKVGVVYRREREERLLSSFSQ